MPDSDRPRRLAIIPARGGSKRIVNKNIRDFCGKPMIAHILEAANKSGLFDEIHVSTEAADIAETATRLGHPPAFARPAAFADDHTPVMPVLKYVTETYRDLGREFDQVCLLMACSPLIEPGDLIGAAAVFDCQSASRSVISVAPLPVPVEWVFDMGDDHVLVPVTPGAFAIRSQDLAVRYYDTGSFVFFAAETVLNASGAGSDTNYLGYVLSPEKAIDIDDENDWQFAEQLFRTRIGATQSDQRTTPT